MKLKNLIYCFFISIFAISCNEPIISTDQITQDLPQSNLLKAATLGKKYYISKTGNNNSTGTSESPFLTIQKGINVSVAGDTVFVKAGTYNEYVNINKSGIGVRNYKSDLVNIDAQNIRVYCIYANGVNNVLVSGLNCKNAIHYNIRFEEVKNMMIQNIKSELPILSTSTSKHVVLGGIAWNTNITLNNIITIGGQFGILASRMINGLTVKNSNISYAAIDGLSVLCSGSDTINHLKNLVVENVESSYNKRQGIVTWGVRGFHFSKIYSHHNGATGLQIENYSYMGLVENSLFEWNCLNPTSNFETGLWIDDAKDVTVRNTISRNNLTGFRVTLSNNITAYNLLIYNNNNGTASGFINSCGIDFSESTASIYNSALYSNGNLNSQRGQVNFRTSGTYTMLNCIISKGLSSTDLFLYGSISLKSDFNNFYNTRTISVYNNGYSTISLDKWKTTSGNEAHSIIADPKYVSVVTNDFRLQSTSPAINKGVNMPGIRTDFNGKLIVGLKDIGAYEY